MNLKTFIFMMLTFREIYQIPRNIQNEPKISYTLNDLEVRSRHSLFYDANIAIIFMLQT